MTKAINNLYSEHILSTKSETTITFQTSFIKVYHRPCVLDER